MATPPCAPVHCVATGGPPHVRGAGGTAGPRGGYNSGSPAPHVTGNVPDRVRGPMGVTVLRPLRVYEHGWYVCAPESIPVRVYVHGHVCVPEASTVCV